MRNRAKTALGVSGVLLLVGLIVAACGGDEPPRDVELTVQAGGVALSELSSTNDEGWTVELSTMKVVFRSFGVRRAGTTVDAEPHGELTGRWLVDMGGEEPTTLGMITLQEGDYNDARASFAFGTASGNDELGGDDVLIGNSVLLRGTADKSGEMPVEFTVTLDLATADPVAGVPMNFQLTPGAETIAWLSFNPAGSSEGGGESDEGDEGSEANIFDGIDFGSADGNGDGELFIGEESPVHETLSEAAREAEFWRVR